MKCPKCGGDCERDMVDVGIGEIPSGPWGCPDCHWVEATMDDFIEGDSGNVSTTTNQEVAAQKRAIIASLDRQTFESLPYPHGTRCAFCHGNGVAYRDGEYYSNNCNDAGFMGKKPLKTKCRDCNGSGESPAAQAARRYYGFEPR